jgi:hypothetical protein
VAPSRTVWEFYLQPGTTVLPPLIAPKVLTVEMQVPDPRMGYGGPGHPVIYVEHETTPGPVSDPPTTVPAGTVLRLYAVPTGDILPPGPVEYVGSVTGVEGWMALHVYRLAAA